jgi:putative ABC transport system permease protein
MTNVHLKSNLKDEFKSNGDITYVYVFSSVAFFILLIACINFINLSTAKSAGRAKEVSIRKVVGSDKKELVIQFLGESVLLCFIALLISLMLVELILPSFRNFVQKPLEIHYFNNFYIIPLLFCFALVIGIISGIYPAFYLSSFRPVQILKGKLKSGLKNSGLRNKLVIFQFTISIILFVGTIVVYEQLQYFQNKKLGFERENVVVIWTPESFKENVKVFRQKLVQNPNILAVTNSHSVPAAGAQFSTSIFVPEGKEEVSLYTCECDYDYLKTFNIEMARGRYFSPEYPTDTSSGIVINESAMRLFGWPDPIGKSLKRSGLQTFTIIGVVKDFNFETLQRNIQPMVLLPNSCKNFSLQRFTSIRIAAGNTSETIDFINKTFKEVAPGRVFRYSFLDERYNRLYENEHTTAKIFIFFSFLAIFVACLGLLGLTTFATEQRTKEVAVRKILGAKTSEIFLILSKESIKWVIIANIFAWPIAYFIMKKWLENFAYKINLGILEFLFAGVIAFIIALFTVSFQVRKVAKGNPVESLKYE